MSSANKSAAQIRFSHPGIKITCGSEIFQNDPLSHGIYKLSVPTCVATAIPETPWTLTPRYGCASVNILGSLTMETSAQESKPKSPGRCVFDAANEIANAVAKTQCGFFCKDGTSRKTKTQNVCIVTRTIFFNTSNLKIKINGKQTSERSLSIQILDIEVTIEMFISCSSSSC